MSVTIKGTTNSLDTTPVISETHCVRHISYWILLAVVD